MCIGQCQMSTGHLLKWEVTSLEEVPRVAWRIFKLGAGTTSNKVDR